MERMDSMHRQAPLAVVRYSMNFPDDSTLMKYMADNHPDAVAEIEGRAVPAEGIKVLLYTSKPVVAEGVTPISIEDNIYESYVNEKALVEGSPTLTKIIINLDVWLVRLKSETKFFKKVDGSVPNV